ncbi:MAG: M20/M25/M40 family metallo-hydrolase, partial [Bacteroidota bacterium]
RIAFQKCGVSKPRRSKVELAEFIIVMKSNLTFFATLFSTALFCQNLPPTITNVQVALGANNKLNISFDLADAEGDPVTVSFRAAARGGQVFDYNTANATGDLGAGIAPGAGKSVEWDFTAYATAMPDFRLQLVADDLQPVDIQAIVDQVDSAMLNGDLTFIQGIRHRTAGAAHLQEVKDLLYFKFLDSHLETYLQEFLFGNYGADNIIGRLIGTENESSTYIIDGHFDTVNDAPGADDNGSAVAGVLEALRVLSPYSFKKSIKFIGFDLEEEGLIGSSKYVQQGILPSETIEGVLNFEMIGYYSEAPNTQQFPPGFGIIFPVAYNQVLADQNRGNFITNIADGNSATLQAAYDSAAAHYVPDLRRISIQAPANWQIITPDLARSDHAYFWLGGIPALMLTDGANYRNPNYHTPNDKIETLDFTFMRRVVQAAVATLAEIAEIQHATTWWADTEFFSPTSEPAACEFSLSPNPVNDFLQVTWENCLPEAAAFSLLDTNGRVVRQQFFSKISQENFRRMDLSGLEGGVYFLKIESGGKVWTSRVVKF